MAFISVMQLIDGKVFLDDVFNRLVKVPDHNGQMAFRHTRCRATHSIAHVLTGALEKTAELKVTYASLSGV